MTDINKVIQGDCLEVMKQIPDKSIDLVLTDPPYGINAAKGTSGFGNSQNRRYTDNWDLFIPTQDYFDEILRVSKNAVIFGGNYFAHLLPAGKCWLVWDKKSYDDFNNPFSDCELIYTTFGGVIKKYTFRQQGFISDSKDERYHPTQKPSELFAKILLDYSSEGMTILDPFSGSGTTAIACIKTNRNYICIEKEPKYIDIINKRIKLETDQLKLAL